MKEASHISETDITKAKDSGFFEYLRNLPADDLPVMLVNGAIPSLMQSVRRHGTSEFSDMAIRLWAIDMILDGLKASTIRRYMGAIGSAYREWNEKRGGAAAELSFSISLDTVDASDTGQIIKETSDNLTAAERMARRSVDSDSPSYIFYKAFLYLLFNPLSSINDLVELKYADSRPDSLHLDDIVISMKKAPQAKYVFPLQQGKQRQPAIVKGLISSLHDTARLYGLKFTGLFSREAITAIWIAAAIKANISYAEIRTIVPVLPKAYSCLSLIPAADITESRQTEILNTVAYSITNKNPGWFVLRLRSGVTPERIKERLKDLESPLQRQIEYFYPLRKVSKMKNKVLTEVEVPFLPGLLFFRLPYDRVTPFMSVVGDLAWCYRTSSNPESPYSVIPQHEMLVFQKTIGLFTSDIEMEIVTELPTLQVGDEVIINDGSPLAGQLATIRKVKSKDGSITYTLQISDTAFIKWEDINLPASHIVKA